MKKIYTEKELFKKGIVELVSILRGVNLLAIKKIDGPRNGNSEFDIIEDYNLMVTQGETRIFELQEVAEDDGRSPGNRLWRYRN